MGKKKKEKGEREREGDPSTSSRRGNPIFVRAIPLLGFALLCSLILSYLSLFSIIFFSHFIIIIIISFFFFPEKKPFILSLLQRIFPYFIIIIEEYNYSIIIVLQPRISNVI